MRRALWLAALVVACGDDDGDASANKKLGELDEQELTELCADVDVRFSRLEVAYVSASCTQKGFAMPATCEATRSQCVATTDPKGSLMGMIDYTCRGTPESVVSVCPQITVAEHDACSDDILAQVEDLSKKITCTADVSKLERPDRPASCTKLGDRCVLLSSFEL